MNEFALVDRVYMDGASLHVEIYKKEKWYEYYVFLDENMNIVLKHSIFKRCFSSERN